MTARRTVVLLIRHGHTDAVGARLVSRLPGVPLNAAGRADVERLRAALAREPLAAIYTSPLERTIETARAVAAEHRLLPQPCHGLIEVDFGDWTGRTFAELQERDDWRRFNTQRGDAIVPGGESAPAVQTRILACLRQLQQRHPGQTVAAVSHADVIRAALLYYSGISLDAWQQMEIDPASVSAIALGPSGDEVLYINQRPSAA